VELAAEQAGDDPRTKKEQELDSLDGHQRNLRGGGVCTERSIGTKVARQYSRATARCQEGVSIRVLFEPHRGARPRQQLHEDTVREDGQLIACTQVAGESRRHP
jgi:hypothetical protein